MSGVRGFYCLSTPTDITTGTKGKQCHPWDGPWPGEDAWGSHLLPDLEQVLSQFGGSPSVPCH